MCPFNPFILKGHIRKLVGHHYLAYLITQISTVAFIKFFTPQMWRLFEGGVYLKVGHDKELFSP